jgi:SAM-dependent methyltransferase
MAMAIQGLVDWYKSWGFCGWLRFRTLWFAHRFIRNSGLAEQWDFVLKYLPYCEKGNKSVLDVGSYGSLFIYEIWHRNYGTLGIDLKGYQEKIPNPLLYVKVWDILDIKGYSNLYDYIEMISVLQFLGKEDRKAIKNIHRLLKPKGIFLLTVPQDKYDYLELKRLTHDYFEILEYQPCRGHLGMAFIKKG